MRRFINLNLTSNAVCVFNSLCKKFEKINTKLIIFAKLNPKGFKFISTSCLFLKSFHVHKHLNKYNYFNS